MFRLLIIIVLIIIILSLLGVNLSSVSENPTLRKNAEVTLKWSGVIWTDYLKEPLGRGVGYLFDKIKGSEVKPEAQENMQENLNPETAQ